MIQKYAKINDVYPVAIERKKKKSRIKCVDSPSIESKITRINSRVGGKFVWNRNIFNYELK